jgi:tetratricopeptide (TPR) repeat protein
MDTLFSGKKVLILEKQMDDLQRLRDLLTGLGFRQIEVASSVNMALSILRERRIDLCFMAHDLGRGEKSGLQVMPEAQAEGIRRYATGFVLLADPEAAALLFGSLEHSPDLCISKPYSTARLRQMIEKLLRLKQVLKPLDELMDGHNWPAALQLCDRKMQAFPALTVFLLRFKGIILLRLERYGEAREVFEQLLESRDQHWMRVGAGVAAYREGRFNLAHDYLGAVIDQQQVSIDAFNWLARLHRLRGELGLSLTLLRKSVLLQPSVAVLQGELGNVAARLGEWRLATDAFRAAIRFGRYSAFQVPDYYYALARALAERVAELQGESLAAETEAEAVRVLEQVITDFGHDRVVQFNSRLLLANLLRRSGELPRAEQAARAALELFLALPLDDQAQWIEPLGDELEPSTLAPRVAALRHELTRKMVGIAWARANLKGMLHFRKAELERARDAFAAALRARPGNPGIGLNLVQAELELIKRGRSPDPLASIRRCDDLLYAIQYAALSRHPQQRHAALSEQLAAQVQRLARQDLADAGE